MGETKSISTTEAMQALQDQFGATVEGGHDEGLRIMADALARRFDISGKEAADLVHALENAHSIRYRPGRGGITAMGPSAGTTTQVDRETTPVRIEGGYWQLEV